MLNYITSSDIYYITSSYIWYITSADHTKPTKTTALPTHLTYPPICPTHLHDLSIHPDNFPEPTDNLPEPTDNLPEPTDNFSQYRQHNFDQISQFRQNFTILFSFYNLNQISKFGLFFCQFLLRCSNVLWLFIWHTWSIEKYCGNACKWKSYHNAVEFKQSWHLVTS